MGESPESSSPYKRPEAFLPEKKREELLAARAEQEKFEAQSPPETTEPFATEFTSPLESEQQALPQDLTETVDLYQHPELAGTEQVAELRANAEKLHQLEKDLFEVETEFEKLASILLGEASKRFPNLAGTLADEADFAKRVGGNAITRWRSQLKVYAEAQTRLADQPGSDMFATALKKIQGSTRVAEELGRLEDYAHDLADKYLDVARGRGEGYSADLGAELRAAMSLSIAKFHDYVQAERAKLKLELDKLSQR